MDKTMNDQLWIVLEREQERLTEASLGLLVEGYRVARELGLSTAAIVMSEPDAAAPSSIAVTLRVDRIYLAENECLRCYDSDMFAQTLSYLAGKLEPRLVLCPHSVRGLEYAPQLATEIGAALLLDCNSIEAGPSGQLLLSRPVSGGRLAATLAASRDRPLVVTMRPRTGRPVAPPSGKSVEVIRVDVPPLSQRVRIKSLGCFKPSPKELDPSQAEVVVAAGRGVGGREKCRILEELAGLLGGCVAGSRAAVDEGWISRDHQIGQTGKSISPELYLACGISGATNHMAGVREARRIVAINTDPDAPIFKNADVAVVADVNQVLPVLADELRRRVKSSDSGDCPEAVVRVSEGQPKAGIAPLNMAVFVRQTRNPQVPVLPGQENSRAGGPTSYVLNPTDEIAVEAALRIRDEMGAGSVNVVSIGDRHSESALRDCLAMGADRAFLIEEAAFAKPDVLDVARILAKFLERVPADVILCGAGACGYMDEAVAASLARLLDLPLVSGVCQLRIDAAGGPAFIQRLLDRGQREMLQCPLPAVLTVEMGLNHPRYPTVKGRLRAIKSPIMLLTSAELGLGPESLAHLTKFVRFTLPRPRGRGLQIAAGNPSAEERMKMLISGGVTERHSNRLAGSAQEIALHLVDYLVAERLIPGPSG